MVKEVSLQLKKGEFLWLVGRIGSGKSSLLQGLMGELEKTEGRVRVADRVMYVSQQPVVLSASVKDNIVFGSAWREDLLEDVSRGCALLKDYEELVQGVHTFVGEQGVTLSGGQRARIALARCAYSVLCADRQCLLLLDDPLSALVSLFVVLPFSSPGRTPTPDEQCWTI